jgi:DNA polymerase-3 subunit epsilon
MTDITLRRPLVFFDLETTGPDRQQDKIIQFCFISFFPDGSTSEFTQLVNPERPISAAATKVHGITDEQVASCFPFRTFAAEVLQIVQDADIVGYGILHFDVPLLFQELSQAGYTWDYTQSNIIDAANIYKRHVPRDLTAAVKFYCNRSLTNAHDARADTLATRDVFIHQLARHELPMDFQHLARLSNYDRQLVDLSGKFSYDDQGNVLFNFSKHKGQRAIDHPGMLQWMLTADFTEDVKIICQGLLKEYELTYEKNLPDLPF